MRYNNLNIEHNLPSYISINIGQKNCIYILLYAIMYALQYYKYYIRL